MEGLRAAGALSLSLVAEGEGGAVLGHAAASPVTLDGAPGWMGIGPVCVGAGHRRRGLGQTLMEEVLERLRAGGAAGAVLVGDPDWYVRFGFRPWPGLHVRGAPEAATLGLPFGEAPPRGRIRYHPAFGLPD